MKELFRTNNVVRLSYAEALLRDRGLWPQVYDQHMSILIGGAVPRRLMVPDDEYEAAKRILIDWGLIERGDEKGSV